MTINDETVYSIPLTTIIAIICITILQAVALVQGVNGTILSATIAALAGLGGYAIGKYRRSKKP